MRSWVFSGETSDVTTVEKVKEDLRGWRLGRCVFVGDAGMNSEENRRKLALGNGKYILASRMRTGDRGHPPGARFQGRYKQVRDNLRVKEVVVGDGSASATSSATTRPRRRGSANIARSSSPSWRRSWRRCSNT